MSSVSKLLFVILIALCGCLKASGALSVRVISWNVLSNKWMNKKFDAKAVETILGPLTTDNYETAANHDIVVIALQEMCYKCNKGNERELAAVFQNVLRQQGDYQFVASTKTRNSNSCEWWACNTFQHGTAALLIFARPGLLFAGKEVSVNGCDGTIIHNAEKGVAGIRTIVKETGQSICFAGLHLDSKSHDWRRKCLKDFWSKARSEASWHACDSVFVAGDFNTRPGPNKNFFKGSVTAEAFGQDFFNASWISDEMVGKTPWGGSRLMDHVEQVSKYDFEEAEVKFYPTYSIQPTGSCGPKPPCYKGTRQPAWTDRILCHNCETQFYHSLFLGKSDHDPVIGIYNV